MHTIQRLAFLVVLASAGCGGKTNVPAYRQCDSDSDCAAQMACVQVWPGHAEKVCAPSCATDAQCPTSPNAAPGVQLEPYCSPADHRCYLGCHAPGACDTDLTCRQGTPGTYNFCL